jgi:hypothetical protein
MRGKPKECGPAAGIVDLSGRRPVAPLPASHQAQKQDRNCVPWPPSSPLLSGLPAAQWCAHSTTGSRDGQHYPSRWTRLRGCRTAWCHPGGRHRRKPGYMHTSRVGREHPRRCFHLLGQECSLERHRAISGAVAQYTDPILKCLPEQVSAPRSGNPPAPASQAPRRQVKEQGSAKPSQALSNKRREKPR